jgi:hypothetical protein
MRGCKNEEKIIMDILKRGVLRELSLYSLLINVKNNNIPDAQNPIRSAQKIIKYKLVRVGKINRKTPMASPKIRTLIML